MTTSREPGTPPAARTLRVRNPVDLIAMVPVALGFHPDSSLVMLALGGRHGGFHARVDLPDDPGDADAMAGCLLDAVRRNRVRGAAVVVFTEDRDLAEAAAAAVVDGLERLGVDVVCAVRTDNRVWHCLGPCRVACGGRCDPDGTPYDATGHRFAAEAVLDGKVTFSSREALRGSLVGADVDDAAAVREAVDRHRGRRSAAARQPLGGPDPAGARSALVAEGRWVEERVRGFLSDRGGLTADEVGRLLVAVETVQVRDVAWSEMSRATADMHVDLWRDVVRRSPAEILAAPASLLAFAAWQAGDGALAWCALDRAGEADPDYSMAALVAGALTAAVPPSAWQPIAKSVLPLFAG